MAEIGDMVGHIRIEALIGRGGMGDVFQGFDTALERHIAVKSVRKEFRMRSRSRSRFLREARLLSRLDHPNICRVYGYLEGDENDYLLLELIEGQTLKQKIDSDLGTEEALRIAEEITAALAVAHGENIVHRDLKPSNVMLTDEGQVKVLDFGLARSVPERERPAESPSVSAETDQAQPSEDVETQEILESDTQELTGTAPGVVLGTLRYMSPEQVLGMLVTAASDLYSLGLVIQEMVTGRPAYEDGLSTSELRNRVACAGTVKVEGVSPQLAGLIAELTAPDPANRPTADEVLRRIRELRAAPLRRRRRLRLAGVAAVLAAVVVVTALITRHFSAEKPWLQPGELPTVAILPFENASDDTALNWVRFGLMQMVSGNLKATKGVEVVPRDDVMKAAEDLEIHNSADLTSARVRKLHRRLGTRIVLAASILHSGSDFRLEYAAHSITGILSRRSLTARDPTELANLLALRVASRLNPSAALPELSDTFSDDVMANREYAAGLQYKVTGGARRARPYFEVSLDRDPEFSRARLQLAKCDRILGKLDSAIATLDQALKQARERSDKVLEGECLTERGVVLQTQGEIEASAQAFDQALKILRGSGNQTILAETLRLKGENLFAQSKWDEAANLYREALRTWQELGNKSGEGRCTNSLGMVAWRRGDWDGAEELFGKALAAGKDLGDRSLQLAALNNLGGVALSQGDLAASRDSFSQALPLAQAAGERLSEASILNNLGIIAYYNRDLKRTEELWKKTLKIRRQVGHRSGEAEVLNNLASLAAQQQRWQDAQERAEQARAIQQELGNTRDEAMCVLNLGEFAFFADEFRRARLLFEEAEKTGKAVGDQQLTTDALVWQGRTAIRLNQFSRAQKLLDHAAKWRPDYELLRLLGIELSYSKGKIQEAIGLATQLKKDLGKAWTPEDQELLDLMLTAQSKGRVIPLD